MSYKDKYAIIVDAIVSDRLIQKVITRYGLASALREYRECRARYGDNVRMTKVILDYGEKV